jgi:hypothetical protein
VCELKFQTFKVTIPAIFRALQLIENDAIDFFLNCVVEEEIVDVFSEPSEAND